MEAIEKDEELKNILDDLKEYDVKLRGLYGLYNTLLLDAESSRSDLSTYFEEMVDLKNSLTAISQAIFGAPKAERSNTITKKQSEIKRIDSAVNRANTEFKDSTKKYNEALKECGSLKTEYKHKIVSLRKEFKAGVQEQTSKTLIKLFLRQMKNINHVMDNIERLISDYNVKRNQVEESSKRFNDLYQSVVDLIDRLGKTA